MNRLCFGQKCSGWRAIAGALAVALAAGCGPGKAGRKLNLGTPEPIEPPKRDLSLLSEVDRTAIEERFKSRSYTTLHAELRKKISIGMTAGELRDSMGTPADWHDRMTTPFQGKVSEWYYTRKVVLVDPPEDEPLVVHVKIVVVIRNGRVSTWYEM